MKKFAAGIIMGGAMACAGIGYLMQDQKARRKMVKKGKKMVVRAEEVMDDLMDDIMEH